MESAQSISFTGYYKGFSVLVTKRDEEAKVQPLIDEAMKAIDYMISKGFKPSWNDETNGRALGGNTAQSSEKKTPTKPCPLHPDKLLYFNPDGKFGPFWSHKTDQVNGNGKSIYCGGYNKKTATVEEYEKVQEEPDF